MKLKRITLENSSGSGRSDILTSELFSITHWHHCRSSGNVHTTTLELHNSIMFYAPEQFQIRFDGHVDLSSDAKCLSQLYPGEILFLMKKVKEQAFIDGGENKTNQIKKVLNITGR